MLQSSSNSQLPQPDMDSASLTLLSSGVFYAEPYPISTVMYQDISSKIRDWCILVQKWSLILGEPSIVWNATPSYKLYTWWDYCFLNRSTLEGLIVKYNFTITEDMELEYFVCLQSDFPSTFYVP